MSHWGKPALHNDGIRMRIIKLVGAISLTALTLVAVNATMREHYPSNLVCGRVITNENDAIEIAIAFMESDPFLSRTSLPAKELRLYRAQNENCCEAGEKKGLGPLSFDYWTFGGPHTRTHWSVTMTIPTQCGLTEYLIAVLTCGGGARYSGSMPAGRPPDGAQHNKFC